MREFYRIIILFLLFNSNGQTYAFTRYKCFVNDAGDNEPYTVLKNLRYGSQPIDYSSDTSSDRLLDIYLPSNAGQEKVPVIFFIHGGGFNSGDKSGNAELFRRLSAKGYAVISINYRLELKIHKTKGAGAGENMSKGLPENEKFNPALEHAVQTGSEDALIAFKWIKENALKYNLDINRLAISGGSAGAMIALYTAYVSDQQEIKIGAVVNLWGGLENAQAIKKNAPPILTYHGDHDNTINVAYAYAISEAMKKNENGLSELHILAGKGHARYDVITREKVDEIDTFLKQILK